MSDDYKDLPPELREQLIHNSGFVKWRLVYKAIKDGDGATIDDILINIYKDSGQILKRTSVQSCLDKLKKNGLISRANEGSPAHYKANQ